MNWNQATDAELLTIINHDPVASLLDIMCAAEEWHRRHPLKSVYSVVQYKIKERCT